MNVASIVGEKLPNALMHMDMRRLKLCSKPCPLTRLGSFAWLATICDIFDQEGLQQKLSLDDWHRPAWLRL